MVKRGKRIVRKVLVYERPSLPDGLACFSAAIREAKSRGSVLDMGESPFARVCQNGGEEGERMPERARWCEPDFPE